MKILISQFGGLLFGVVGVLVGLEIFSMSMNNTRYMILLLFKGIYL